MPPQDTIASFLEQSNEQPVPFSEEEISYGSTASTPYPGYEIPKQSLLDYLEIMQDPFSKALSKLVKFAIESGQGGFESEFPSFQDIYNKVDDEQLKIFLNTDRVEIEGGARGFYSPGSAHAVPDTIFLPEATVSGSGYMDPSAGGEPYYEMMDATLSGARRYHDMGIGPGYGESIPHELFHANITDESGKSTRKQIVHGWPDEPIPEEELQFKKWLESGTEFAKVPQKVFSEAIKKNIYPATKYNIRYDEMTPAWNSLRNILEGYKDWKLSQLRQDSSKQKAE
jgi:hypothetical protein